MTLEIQRRLKLLAGVVILTGAIVVLCIRTGAKLNSPFAYMVAGTLATSILLAAAFVVIVKRGYLGGNAGKPGTSGHDRVIRRTARKSGRSS